MTKDMFSTLPPMVVPAFNRVWHLTPWIEPVWRVDGRLVALEMLSRPVDRDTGTPALPAWFFARAPQREQFRILRWQLGMLVLMMPWCAARHIPVSLNIGRPLAMHLLADPATREELLALAPYVRLEINECFLSPGIEQPEDRCLQGLAELAPLWLDDFGAGSTGLSWLMSGIFEAVKIDRRLMEKLLTRPGGDGFLAGLCELARGLHTQVIAEGVATPALLAFAQRTQITACQGWLWPGLSPEQIYQLADQLPEVNPGDLFCP